MMTAIKAVLRFALKLGKRAVQVITPIFKKLGVTAGKGTLAILKDPKALLGIATTIAVDAGIDALTEAIKEAKWSDASKRDAEEFVSSLSNVEVALLNKLINEAIAQEQQRAQQTYQPNKDGNHPEWWAPTKVKVSGTNMFKASSKTIFETGRWGNHCYEARPTPNLSKTVEEALENVRISYYKRIYAPAPPAGKIKSVLDRSYLILSLLITAFRSQNEENARHFGSTVTSKAFNGSATALGVCGIASSPYEESSQTNRYEQKFMKPVEDKYQEKISNAEWADMVAKAMTYCYITPAGFSLIEYMFKGHFVDETYSMGGRIYTFYPMSNDHSDWNDSNFRSYFAELCADQAADLASDVAIAPVLTLLGIRRPVKELSKYTKRDLLKETYVTQPADDKFRACLVNMNIALPFDSAGEEGEVPGAFTVYVRNVNNGSESIVLSQGKNNGYDILDRDLYTNPMESISLGEIGSALKFRIMFTVRPLNIAYMHSDGTARIKSMAAVIDYSAISSIVTEEARMSNSETRWLTVDSVFGFECRLTVTSEAEYLADSAELEPLIGEDTYTFADVDMLERTCRDYIVTGKEQISDEVLKDMNVSDYLGIS